MIRSWLRREGLSPWLRCALTLLFSVSYPLSQTVIAADYLTLQLGGWQTAISVADLENWQKTGDIPPSLTPYRWILTPETRQLLGKRLSVDSVVATAFLEQMEASGEGKQLLQQLTTALPNTSPEVLKETLIHSWQHHEDFRGLSFIRAYPEKNLTVDLGKLGHLGLKFQKSNLKSQLLRPYLQKTFQRHPLASATALSDPSQSGTQRVRMRTLILSDLQRKRRIPIDIYQGETPTEMMVVMSHGFAADRRFGIYLARHLASHGITVVTLEHPGSNIQALVDAAWGVEGKEILAASEFWQRPQDVQFVLDQLERLNRLPAFAGKFPTQSVVMVGHSFGGYTAFALAGATVDLKRLRQFCQTLTPLERSPADWLQCSAAKLPYAQLQFKDERIKGIIALNPITGQLFTDLSQVTLPSLILSSSDDGITPVLAHQLQPFQQLRGQKYLVMAMGATHMSISDVNNLDSAIAQSTLVREVMGAEAEPVRQGVKGVSLAFIKQFSDEATHYQPFLKEDYLPRFSTPETQLYLSQQLPLKLRLLMPMLERRPSALPDTSSWLATVGLNRMGSYWETAQQWFYPSAYCQRQVDDMLTALLKNGG